MPRPSPLMVLLIGLSLGLVLPAEAATRGYTITSFDAIRVDAPVTVVVTTGSGASARADGDQAALDRLKVDVSGRLLIISMTRPRSGEKSGGAATLRLSTGMIDRIVLTGGGSVMVDRMKGLQGQIVLGGNGDVGVADVALDRIDVALAGGGFDRIGRHDRRRQARLHHRQSRHRADSLRWRELLAARRTDPRKCCAAS